MMEQSRTERKELVAEALTNVLENQDAFVVKKNGREIYVTDWDTTDASAMSELQPELYGCLLEIDHKLADAGATASVISLLAAAAFCLAVHMEWLDNLFGASLEAVRSIWVYIVVMVAVFFLTSTYSEACERSVFRRRRDVLYRKMNDAGYSRHTLITVLQNDQHVRRTLTQVKQDDPGDEDL